MPKDIRHRLPAPLAEELGPNKQKALENFELQLLLALEDDDRFKEIIQSETTWKTSDEDKFRGYKDIKDSTGVTTTSAEQQNRVLELMLRTIASVIPVISESFIIKQSKSLDEIWKRLRLHYGIRKTGGRILDFNAIGFQHGQESYEAYWERLYTFIEGNLLDPADKIKHGASVPKTKEQFSPTLYNLLTFHWLNQIDSRLPQLVKQRFATELRSQTVFSIRPEISEAIPSLVLEGSPEDPLSSSAVRFNRGNKPFNRFSKRCSLCTVSGKTPTDHFLKSCPHLLAHDKSYLANRIQSRSLDIEDTMDQNESGTTISSLSINTESKPQLDVVNPQTQPSPVPLISRTVDVEGSPILHLKYGNQDVEVVLDYGSTGDLIDINEAKRLHLPISPTNQCAQMADGGTPMNIVGETRCFFVYGHHQLEFSGLVASKVKGGILGGVPFHRKNDIHVRIKNHTISIGDCCQEKYQPSPPSKIKTTRLVVIARIPAKTTILPSEGIRVKVPEDMVMESQLAIEPRLQSKSLTTNPSWLRPEIVDVTDGTILLTNSSGLPVQVATSDQVCNIRRVCEMSDFTESRTITQATINMPARIPIHSTPGDYFSTAVEVNPKLPSSIQSSLQEIHQKYDEVFDPAIGLYNGANGPFEGRVNMGPTLPPQRKGRCPQYSHKNLELLQEKHDDLYRQGVTARPSDLGISIEYVSPSFLVRKPNGDPTLASGYRLVTSFGEVAKYAKPQPALMPRVDDTLRKIGQWSYIIKTDLSNAYYQIPLAKDSLKYCGTCTPFGGVRTYTRCVMGMPGSETALEEMMGLVLKDLIKSGVVVKLADDLFCGGNSREEVLNIWEEVLARLHRNGLRLSPSKTSCFPESTVILGWIWSNGTITASPHRFSALQTCNPPETIKGLRSFVGSFKAVSKVVPIHSDVLHPLELETGGRESREKLVWTDTLTLAFKNAQKRLSSARTITLPRPSDHLRIVTDAATSKSGLAATLYIIRNGTARISGFYNAKMTDSQTRWLPCEAEALCIHQAVRFFSPYLIQSHNKATVLTDSKPCVEAYQKILRGQFSSSARVMTFVSSLCDYGADLLHVKGADNSLADFTSRNTIECPQTNCQICKFVTESEQSVVRELRIANQPSIESFLNRTAWLSIQRSCPNLQRVHAHLRQGTRPSRKLTKIKDIRAYLRKARIATDGLLVVPSEAPFRVGQELIVIPRTVSAGVMMALHLRLEHASMNELSKVCKRHFSLLNRDAVLRQVTEACEVCASLRKVPSVFKEQSTTVPPETIGRNYSADVVRRCRQKILLLREDISAYTSTGVVPDETAKSLRDGLICLLATIRPTRGGLEVKVRTDAASAFRSLSNDDSLHQKGITIELGDEKNRNKNPIAERAISELHYQITKLQPDGGPITNAILATATANMNALLRESGISAFEIWTQRDQTTGEQLPIQDRTIIRDRYNQRLRAHQPSAKYQSRGKTGPTYSDIKPGDLVYLIQDRDKTKARDRYLVIEVHHPRCIVQKFRGDKLRARRYRVDLAECIRLKFEPKQLPLQPPTSDQSDSTSDSVDSVNDDEDIPISDHSLNDSDDNAPQDNNENFDNIFEDRNIPPDDIPPLRRSQRERRRPTRFADYYVGNFTSDSEED